MPGSLIVKRHMGEVFVSGHTQDVVIKEGAGKGAAFPQKPLPPTRRAGKVLETLDPTSPPGGQP